MLVLTLKANKMKNLLVLLLLLCSIGVTAQDVIVKKDGKTEVCRVEKVSDTDVTYKKWSDLKGPSYIMDISLVASINYENGEKKTFGERIEVEDSGEGKPSMSDAELLEMDKKLHPTMPFVISINEKELMYKKVKRLKTWGWIGGGVLAAGGILLLAAGVAGLIEQSQTGLCAGGAVCLAAGIGVTTTCLVIAHKQKKKLDAALEYSSLYRYDIPFSNGSQLSVGADMLHDRIMDKRTIGLGLSYNF